MQTPLQSELTESEQTFERNSRGFKNKIHEHINCVNRSMQIGQEYHEFLNFERKSVDGTVLLNHIRKTLTNFTFQVYQYFVNK